MRRKFYSLVILVFLFASLIQAQSRIDYNGQKLFLSGSNVAWINFAGDIGPAAPRISDFRNYFQSISQAGGNSIRFWLHTTGTNTPEFNSDGFVVGPGKDAVANLKKILDVAWENKVGMILSIWSFDMLRKNMAPTYLTRNRALLMDTVYTRAFINNSLLPMVRELKNHPAIICWEVFNEPEGMSTEFGWSDITTKDVPMFFIQRFINLVAGAIHREDSNAKVTNGSWGFPAQTDVATLGKKTPEESILNLPAAEKQKIEDAFEKKYNVKLKIEEIAKIFSITGANKNYYRDDRLIQAGGDQKGTLDFYTVHYYDWAGIAMSPFHFPYSYWNLDKPLVVAEFYVQDTFGITYEKLYRKLFDTGYAGAVDWGWDNSTYSTRAKQSMRELYRSYPYEIVVSPKSGVIYSFSAQPPVVEKGDSTIIEWKTAVGSHATLNGQPVNIFGNIIVKPTKTELYKLETTGDVPSSATTLVEYTPPGKIFSFRSLSTEIAAGESTRLIWETSKGSSVTINGQSVKEDGSLIITPTQNPSKYTLISKGDVTDSSSIMIYIVAPEKVNRVLNKSIIASSVYDATTKPEFANDGNLFTSWISQYTDVQWIEIDLGSNFTLSKINIYWGNEYAKVYRVGISADRINYQLIKTNQNGLGGIETIDNLQVTGRYLKFLFDKRAVASKGYSIMEIEAYGKQEPNSVDDEKHELPSSFSLDQNYPNPFNPTTIIKYSIPFVETSRAPSLQHISLKVYDILGREIATLVNEEKQAGVYEVSFNSESISNSSLPSGVYFYSLSAGKFSATRKMILLR